MRLKQYLTEYESYVGMHQAPTNDGFNAPLYDVTLNDLYPDDIYSSNGARLYGDGNNAYDNESMAVIFRFHNKPNGKVKIYRAVPDEAFDLKKKQKELNQILTYYYKFNFFPMNNEIVDKIESKYNLDYDEKQKAILNDIKKQIDNIYKEIKAKPKMKLNKGDWVTISKKYAEEHGKSNLGGRFKVLSKTVLAKTLWTDANSINEWGYDPR